MFLGNAETQRRMLRCGYIDDETVLMLAAAPLKVRLARTVPAWNVYLAQDVQEPCTPTEELNSYFSATYRRPTMKNYLCMATLALTGAMMMTGFSGSDGEAMAVSSTSSYYIP